MYENLITVPRTVHHFVHFKVNLQKPLPQRVTKTLRNFKNTESAAFSQTLADHLNLAPETGNADELYHWYNAPLPIVLKSMHHHKRVPGLSKTVSHGIMKLSILPGANVIVRKENGAIPSVKLTVLILKLPGIKCAQVFLKLNNSIMLINLQMQTQKWCFKQ